MHVAFIGLGSNLGNERNGIFESPKQQLLNAIQSIDNQTTIHLLKTSHFYQTQAIGPGDQPDYINAAIKIETSLSANQLLLALQSIENQQGRVRKERWGARTLDLDILVFDQLIENSEQLILPHPRAHERAFVLAPLNDLQANLVIPKRGNISSLLANCSMQGIVKLND
ncbi:2-amino-4-hydroxy-6-hydroxymethyldihydropteridine diphosphokinase [Porticoccaceae bacterium]|jgi:2-amino-4-hydroxy-6-hydroxymethyldihydropteridine diphosphokinase|nr:2-amino-4-hydroxy-6-hydroxymethyldihydropteridine diphosphokinase [Cellvibrionales bacterium]MDA8898327.1 2-amino-4-hydroxy-6-hydroxymethyldihydropteridine diphosphokinase [Porticoccaceae bacterium]